MQYILTEEEYKNLIQKEKYHELLDKIETLNNKVLELTRNGKCMKENGGYCDFCPLSGFEGTGTCMKVKEYSK